MSDEKRRAELEEFFKDVKGRPLADFALGQVEYSAWKGDDDFRNRIIDFHYEAGSYVHEEGGLVVPDKYLEEYDPVKFERKRKIVFWLGVVYPIVQGSFVALIGLVPLFFLTFDLWIASALFVLFGAAHGWPAYYSYKRWLTMGEFAEEQAAKTDSDAGSE